MRLLSASLKLVFKFQQGEPPVSTIQWLKKPSELRVGEGIISFELIKNGYSRSISQLERDISKWSLSKITHDDLWKLCKPDPNNTLNQFSSIANLTQHLSKVIGNSQALHGNSFCLNLFFFLFCLILLTCLRETLLY